MTAKFLSLSASIFALAVTNFSAVLVPTDANAYDMDCKVILCIAGGFPSGCSDAYAYMISRITRWPTPLPPFGFCPMSNGQEYKNYDANYSYLGGQSGYDCPEGLKLHYTPPYYEEDNSRDEVAFCYSHMTTDQVQLSDDTWTTEVIYHNRATAIPVNFQLNIIIEPGTDVEYKSPLFRINTGTGYVSQKKI